jgi:hypothetical protein
MKPSEEIRFVCAICGAKSAQPILCLRDRCPTETTVHYTASAKVQ